MPTEWTPERRAQQSAAMKKSHADKRAEVAASLTDAAEIAAASAPSPAADPNPVASEGIVPVPPPPDPPAKSRATRQAKSVGDVGVIDVRHKINALIHDLETLEFDVITYDDCGRLINTLSATTTATATRRRQAQEQLEAGTRRVACTTCGRMIDITKSGGFQILTERDEHFQPVNHYYCSTNCVLARNMPSHRTKKLPGDVGAPVR